jgi:hypothetical protein
MVESGSQFFFKLCSDHLAVEAIPKRRLAIDLLKVRKSLEVSYLLKIWTPHFVVLMSDVGEEITLRRDGRMIIRNAKSEEGARLAAVQVLNHVKDG